MSENGGHHGYAYVGLLARVPADSLSEIGAHEAVVTAELREVVARHGGALDDIAWGWIVVGNDDNQNLYRVRDGYRTIGGFILDMIEAKFNLLEYTPYDGTS